MLTVNGCSPVTLLDANFLYEVLGDTPEEAGMEQVSVPTVLDVMTSNPDNDGMVGFVATATGYIVFRVWPGENTVYVDMVSREPFASDDLVPFLKERFRADEVATSDLVGKGERLAGDVGMRVGKKALGARA